MKASMNQGWMRRALALAAVLLLCLTQAAPAAAEMAQALPPLVFTLTWEDQAATAAQMTAPGYEDGYWLYLPAWVDPAAVTLRVSDTWGQYSAITLDDGTALNADGLPLSSLYFEDAGAEPGMQYRQGAAYQFDGQAVGFRLFISRQTDTPAQPQMPVAQPAAVTVVCLDSAGGELQSTSEMHEPGVFTVYAPEIPGYTLNSEAMVSGLVDLNGANPARVEFYYVKQAQPANVTIVCIEQGGGELSADTQTFAPGEFTVTAPVKEGYQLVSADTVKGVVDANGANPAKIEFYYTKIIQPANVTIVCIEQNGGELSADTQTFAPGEFTVTAPVKEGYQLVSADTVKGVVDANGANPARVEFYYTKIIQPANVTIVCIEHNGGELSADTQTFAPGEFTVTAPVKEGYQLMSADTVKGVVDANGANPARVEFYYTKIIQPANVTIVCIEQDVKELSTDTQTFAPGEFTVTAPVKEGYQLVSADTVKGIVDANGANPAKIEFYYTKIIQPASVTILCTTQDGGELRTETRTFDPGPFTITAPVLEGYDLVGEESYTGTVNADGANPSHVQFWYAPHINNVKVRVAAMDEKGEIFNEYIKECVPGANLIEAETWQGFGLQPGETGQVTVLVTADGAEPAEVIFHYVRDAAQVTDTPAPVTDTPAPVTDTPAPVTDTPAPVTDTPAPVAVTVPVYYRDTQGNLLSQAEATLKPGENYVQLDTDRVSSAYTLTGESSVRVTVDANGACTPDSVTFLFIAPVDVRVLYLDFNDEPVADPQVIRCVAGVNPIDTNPQNLLEGYILADDGRKYVNVDDNGADQEELIFRYSLQVQNPDAPEATDEPRLALVPVYYRTTTSDTPFYVDNTVKCLTGDNTVQADPAHVPEGYKPEGPTAVQVTVDDEGNPSPATVEFLYNVSDMTRDVKVYYRDVNGRDLVDPQMVPVGVGNRTVSADAALIPEGWRLLSDGQQAVRLEEDGTLLPDFVVFTLEEIPVTPEPRRTVEPVDYPVYDMDAYGYPKNDGTALRSFPSDDEINTIGVADRGDLAHIEGYVTNSLGDTWYIVTVGDQTGYMRDTQVRLLSAEDMNALFGTPIPSTPTPPPETPIPDGAFIDRWATLNANSVNFRAEASTKSTSYGQYGKTQKLFIYDSVTVDGAKWYRANVNGRDGFMMARYVDLMSAADSAAYQATLSSPMPQRTPLPTPVPETPTPVPATATPEPTQPITPSPAPYTGYALTTRMVDLRTGVTVSDTTLATLPANTLLYLYGQAYVNGVCWNSVDAYAVAESGYVQEEALRRITAEEAIPYLAALQKTDSPAPPTIQPDPYTGYAITKGSNVMLRNYADEKAEIAAVLPQDEVVWVLGQEYVAGSSYYWEVVQSGKLYGYVRSDQLRMLEPAERAAYEESLRTPVPEVQIVVTVPPVTQSSMSSYGYVTTNNVRLRSGPGKSNTQIRMMNQYAFALVLGSEMADGSLWYHINQAGTEGYVMADYFKVLSLGELSEFLTSDEYRQSTADTGVSTGSTGYNATTGNAITSVEDFNSGVWKNPALTNVTYEPFSNIIASPTPDVEQLATVTPSASPTATDTPTPEPTGTVNPATTPEPNASSSGGSGWLWVGLVAAAAVAGGGAYVYSIYRGNQRRAAQRKAAQRKQATPTNRAAYQQPTQQVPAQGQRPAYPTQNNQRAAQPSVFTPPKAAASPTQAVPRAGSQAAPGNYALGNNNPPAAPGNTPASPDNAANNTPVRHRRSERHQS